MPNLGGWEWVILAVVALLLFGGTRLAGIGKSAGKAIREFKEETATISKKDEPAAPDAVRSQTKKPAAPEIVDAETVEDNPPPDA